MNRLIFYISLFGQGRYTAVSCYLRLSLHQFKGAVIYCCHQRLKVRLRKHAKLKNGLLWGNCTLPILTWWIAYMIVEISLSCAHFCPCARFCSCSVSSTWQHVWAPSLGRRVCVLCIWTILNPLCHRYKTQVTLFTSSDFAGMLKHL